VPLVIDADGLNGLACDVETAADDGLPKLPPRDSKISSATEFPRVLTPHPGEFARLIRRDIPFVEGHREELATQFAGENQVILVLKGQRTLIADGDRLAVNTTGNNGMATGGSGDVLTGLITALLAQRMPAFDAAQLGVHLHGLAGDLAAAELTQPAMIASDLLRFLPQAWRKLGAD